MHHILLIDDNNDDAVLFKRACQHSGMANKLNIVTNGQAVMDYLSGTSEYADRLLHPLPQLVFLDINLPRGNGFQVLEWIRNQPAFNNLPVIMLSVSGYSKDIDRAYEAGANSFIIKVHDLKQFNAEVQIALQYWLNVNVTTQRPRETS